MGAPAASRKSRSQPGAGIREADEGWRLANFKPAPSSPPDDSYSPSPSVDSTPTPSGPDMAQQTADLNASMAAAQAQNDAANAATVQTEYQFNTIYSNPNQ